MVRKTKITMGKLYMSALNLGTSRLTLRPFETADLEGVHGFFSSPETMKYMLRGPYRLEETQAWIDQARERVRQVPVKDLELGALEKETSQLIGRGAIHLDDAGQEAMLGWIIHSAFGGRGYATELALALRDYAFQSLGVHRIYALCHPDNVPSWHIMEKIGMRKEGHFIEKRMRVEHGVTQWNDELEYAMLRSEWERL